MTAREGINKLIATGQDFTAGMAAEYTGRSKSMCNLILIDMVNEGLLKCRKERLGQFTQVNMYSKDETATTLDLGSSMRAQMITKAWKPGEIKLNRQWRKPTEQDKARKCRARSQFEKYPFYVNWNTEYNCWALSGTPHILILVGEILEPRL
jgi:hypothetical protein